MLLEYISTKNIPCVLTMHDCWTFTGHCAYFDFAGCDKWKIGCNHYPSLRDYPKTFAPIDPSSWNNKMKKKLFTPLSITFVSPSQWLCVGASENVVRKDFAYREHTFDCHLHLLDMCGERGDSDKVN